jgi:hypothetical protein
MYRGSRYNKINIKYSDIFDGIIDYVFTILSVSTLIYVLKIDDEIPIYTFSILLVFPFLDILTSIFWTIHFITYSKSVKEYEKTQTIKRITNMCLIGIAGIFYIIILVINFNGNYIVLYLVVSQLIISFLRLLNYYFYFMHENW